MGLLTKTYWIFAGLGGLWAIIIGLLLNPSLQRFALYANKVHTAYWTDLNRTEQFGFLPGQIQPFNIQTPDNESLYAWHILPLGAYRQYETGLFNPASGVSDSADASPSASPTAASVALTALKSNPSSRLVIKFHGNAGHVAQGWRPDTYRMLIGAGPDIHVLAFDYRGFGISSGSPTEDGLVTDGVAVIDWALNVAGIPADRIVLYGQSLGTAVATAVTEYFITKRGIEFAGLVLVAPFTSIRELLPRYFIGGFIPTLSPLRGVHPRIMQFVLDRVVDTWTTAVRLARIVRESKALNLAIIHARNDAEIPSSHSEHLFLVAANATTAAGMEFSTIFDVKERVDLNNAGFVDTWTAEDEDGLLKKIKLVMFPYGGHNRIMTWPIVAKEVLDCFDRASTRKQ